ncbi:MAG TPA: hypothetical protein PKW35_24940 [Nannocystaceae bacterium]|nr:hypothetical protein [Nannocystaceae bacterium]
MAPPASSRSRSIAGPIYDLVFFIGSPLWALVLGIAVARTPLSTARVTLFGHSDSPAGIFIGSLIMAHLGLVFVRSHANREIFRRFPLRFTVVPLALFAAIYTSEWALVSVSVLATWWDVYHSSLQTFGLGRIYDLRAGNDAQAGRRLDYLLNLLLYAGPILAGATLMAHVGDFEEFEAVGSAFFTSIPAAVESRARWLTWGVVGIGVPFLTYYVLAYVRLARRGYRVSPHKVALYAITGLCSIFTWGFDSFGEAFFIMNLFHAVQYFALVWWTERANLTRLLHARRQGAALAAMVGAAGLYGVWAELCDPDNRLALGVVSVVSIMHFWYDGFIWSARRREV